MDEELSSWWSRLSAIPSITTLLLTRLSRRACSETFSSSLLAATRVVTASAMVLYLLVAASSWLEPARPAPKYPVPQFPPFHVDPDSGRILDAHNRERVFHGVNVVYKAPPWHPPVLDSFHPALSFSAADVAILKSLGLNVVRLGVMWPGVHPARGQTNDTYLLVMKRLVRRLRAAGIYTLVDFHQDVFGSRFCGEGAPSWLFDEQTVEVSDSSSTVSSSTIASSGSSSSSGSRSGDSSSTSPRSGQNNSSIIAAVVGGGNSGIIDGGGGILPCVGFAVCMHPIEYAKSFPEPLSSRFHRLPRGTLEETAETTGRTAMTMMDARATEATAAGSTGELQSRGNQDTEKFPGSSPADSGADGQIHSSSRTLQGSDPDQDQCRRHSWSDYHFTYAVARAFQDLYENRWGWRDRLAEYWTEVARAMRDEDGVLGYDLINEPWVGDEFWDPMLMAPGVADKLNLAPLYEHLEAAIRSQDPNRLIAFETVTFDDAVSGLRWVPGGKAWRNMSVLSYHHYQPPNIGVKATMKQRMAERERLKCGAMLTEFSLPSIPVGADLRGKRGRYAGDSGVSETGMPEAGSGRVVQVKDRELVVSPPGALLGSGCTVQKQALQWAEMKVHSAAGKSVLHALLSCNQTETEPSAEVAAAEEKVWNGASDSREAGDSLQPALEAVDSRRNGPGRDDGGRSKSFEQGAWEDLGEILDAADEHGQSWMAWEYKPFHPITGANLGLFLPNGSLDMHLALTLARTYPQAVAGRIIHYRFNASTASFHLAYSANHALPPVHPSKLQLGNEIEGSPAGAALEFLTEIYCYRCGEAGWTSDVHVQPATVKWEVKGRMVEVQHQVEDAGERVDVWITHERVGVISQEPGGTSAV